MCEEEPRPGPCFLPTLQEPWQQQNRLQQLYHYALAAERVRMTQQHQQHPLNHHQPQTSNQHQPGIPYNYRNIPPNHFFPNSPHSIYPQTNPIEVSGYMALLHAQHQSRLMHQFHDATSEPKPQQSYIGLIAMAILSSPERKLVLSDIYQHILDHHPYFRRRGPGWRNSIRHNLSLNDCFVKSGRSANGKGHYWSIHPANVEDFKRGDFRRRRAQRKVRRHMGLVADDEPDSPSPPPIVDEVREDAVLVGRNVDNGVEEVSVLILGNVAITSQTLRTKCN
ncbi:hypothetical protein QAD02_004646 [Eretmocerus hayati]|uniref:Uncharacterized protein n=1 Tax=Eretmocerus hayati TaxID=131215 RepID=A0ACC2NSV9_9HYME|nr:hypothetical protein QAD02_004646 [Eretmocerus hayati]